MTPGTPRLLVLGQVNHLHVRHMADAMATRGFEVVVAGQEREGFGATPEPQHGIRQIVLPSASGSLGGVVSQVRELRRVARDVRPDVVFAHWLCGYCAFAAIGGLRPLISMAWGSDVLRASRFQRVANRIALRRSEYALGDSIDLCDAMASLTSDSSKIKHQTWGVDLDRFSPAPDRASVRAALGLPAGRLVLSPRSLLPVYNPNVVLEAFRIVADRLPDVHFAMLSLWEGAPQIRPFPYPERLHPVGHVPYERMPEFFRAADVTVSIPSSDAFPRTAWEAMACGSPLVLSDLPWLHRELEIPKHALVVPIDANAVADAILELLENRELAASIEANGRQLALERQDTNVEMDRLAELIRGVARTSPGR